MKVYVVNKKAYYDYEILETYEAGISLLGPEVKAIRNSRVSLFDAYCKIKGSEVFIVNMNITPINPNSFFEKFNPLRERKLLLKKSEIKRLIGKVKEKGLTLIPLRIYAKNRWIKVEIALVRGKTQYDKRQAIKKKEEQREIQRILKLKNR
jgi:SsrA-binding protein